MVVGYAISVMIAIYATIQLIEQKINRKLTVAEEAWLFTHAHHVTAIWDATREAFDREKKIFAVNGEDDEGDAFRHCIWSSMLTRDIGHADAAMFTSLHEQKDGTAKDRKNMDLHNNAVGRWTQSTPNTNDHMQREVLTMLVKGKLHVRKSNPGKKLLAAYYAKLTEAYD